MKKDGLLKKIKKLEQEIEALTKKTNDNKDLLNNLLLAKNQLENELKEKKAQFENSQNNITELTRKLKQIDSSIQSFESSGSEQTTLLNKLKGEKSVLESNIQQLEEQADGLENKVNQNEKTIF